MNTPETTRPESPSSPAAGSPREGDWPERARSLLPAVQRWAYLNTGSFGPLSRPAEEALAAWSRRQLEEGRIRPGLWDEMDALAANLRKRFARLVHAPPGSVALTHHTTDGMNIATWGLRWRTGDTLVTLATEHPGGMLPVYAAARHHGLDVRVVAHTAADTEASLLAKLEAAITSRTRLVAVSHVSWKTGMVLPIREIAALAHARGALLAVDGAQAVGAIPVDVQALDADFYAFPGQKWLCGPEGVGGLYVRPECLDVLHPTFVGYASLRDGDAWDETGHFLPAPGARRYETSTVYTPGLAGMVAGLTWLESLGFGRIFAQVQEMTRLCRRELATVPGVEILSPSPFAGLTVFRMAHIPPEDVVAFLARRGVLVRSVRRPDRVRVSTHFFNTPEDISRLVAGLQALEDERRRGGIP